MSAGRDAGAWSRQPVVLLGALILATTIIACSAMIVLAWRFADVPIDSHGGHAMVPSPQSTEVAARAQQK